MYFSLCSKYIVDDHSLVEQLCKAQVSSISYKSQICHSMKIFLVQSIFCSAESCQDLMKRRTKLAWRMMRQIWTFEEGRKQFRLLLKNLCAWEPNSVFTSEYPTTMLCSLFHGKEILLRKTVRNYFSSSAAIFSLLNREQRDSSSSYSPY